MAAPPKKQEVENADYWFEHDEQLKANKVIDRKRFGGAASDSSVAAAVAALEKNGHTTKVVDNKAQALEYILTRLPKNKPETTVSAGASCTLTAIGLFDYLSGATALVNHRSKIGAANAAGAWGTVGTLSKQAVTADFFFASVSAVAETGEIVTGDLTGSRWAGLVSGGATEPIIVVGTNKIVANLADGLKRLQEYALPLESARVRVAYKVPASNLSNTYVINTGNPYKKDRITVVIVKEVLGF